MKTKYLLFLFIGMLIIVTLFLVLFRGDSKVNNWILAYCTIALVFSTIYYAIQTYKLYAEGQKNRYANFWESRISEFYMPFTETLIKIDNFVSSDYQDIAPLYDLHNKLVKLLWEKGYMVSNETAKEIREILPTLYMFRKNEVQDNILISAYRKKRDRVGKLINEEWKLIEDQIRKLYGSYATKEKKDENRKR